MQGSWTAIVYVTLSAATAGCLIAEAIVTFGRGGAINWLLGVASFVATLVVGSATLWIGAESPLTLVVVGGGAVLVVFLRRGVRPVEQATPSE